MAYCACSRCWWEVVWASFSPLSPYLWEMARYRLKYYLKGLLNRKTNQPNSREITVQFSFFLPLQWDIALKSASYVGMVLTLKSRPHSERILLPNLNGHSRLKAELLNYIRLRPEFFYFLVLGSADPNFWKSRIKIKLGSKSFIFILSADRLMPSTNEIKARTIF